MTQQLAAEKVKRAIRDLDNLKHETALAKVALGMAIRKWRIVSEISAEEFATLYGVSKPFVSMMETGSRPVPKRFLGVFES